MAEFQEVMEQWGRLCKSINGLCRDCPLSTLQLCSVPVYELCEDELEKSESRIMQWAAEHPEPVYPMWRDVLLKCGLLYEKRDNKSGSREIKPNWPEMAKPIPADIAQKLGIEPKETNP